MNIPDNEIKNVLFATYMNSCEVSWSASILKESSLITKLTENDYMWLIRKELNSKLILFSLTTIDKEDLLYLYCLHFNIDVNESVSIHSYSRVNNIHHITVTVTGDHPHFDTLSLDINELSIKQIDYLRSKGYALSFRNFSVDDMIEKKWIEVKYKKS